MPPRNADEPGHHAETFEAACACARVGQGAFDGIDAVREVRRNQCGGAPPSEADASLAIDTLERPVPPLMALLKGHLD